MSTLTPTPTPRTDAATYPADCLGKTLVTNCDCSRALERELVALTAERDRLRAEVERLNALGSWAHTCIHHNDEQRAKAKSCPVCATSEREQLRAERDSIKQEIEMVEHRAYRAEVERDQLRSDCENETKWAAHYLAQSIADKTRAERAEADLATERARLDWVFRNCKVTSDGYPVHDREDLGVAMQEDAK